MSGFPVEAALSLLAVAVVTAALRLVPAWLWPGAGSDAGYHLLLRREIRRNRMRVPARLAPLALDERQTYPWLYHWVLAWLPERWLRSWPALPSAAIDVLHGTIAFGLAIYLAPRADPNLEPWLCGLLAGLLFGTSPALVTSLAGSRAFEITPRPFGELLFSATIAATGVGLVDGSAWMLALAALAGGAMLLASKFAAQVLVFCVPLMAIATGDWALLLLLLAAPLAALLLSGGQYWWILRGQLVHLRLYRDRLQHDHPAVAARNQWRGLWHALVGLAQSGGRDRARVKELARFVEDNTYFQFLLRNALICGLVLLALSGSVPGWVPAGAAWERWLWAWTLVPILPFVLTSQPGWRFLGEAERYPEYGIAPACVLVAVAALRLPTALAVTLAVVYVLATLAAILYSYARQRFNSRLVERGALDELVGYLQTLPPGRRILTAPIILALGIASRLEHVFLMGLDPFVWARDYDRIFHGYPWPGRDLAWWRTTHRLELIVAVRNAGGSGIDVAEAYGLEQFRPVFANDAYAVYEVELAPVARRADEIVSEPMAAQAGRRTVSEASGQQ